ncbi:MAG: RNA methyltransferase [Cyclobacteriaceae bacterium]|nr:RNA methyltransferase [Cyclobacteriaceae bacterium]
MEEADKIQSLTTHFSQFISDHKKNFMERVLEHRTRYVTIVMEDIYQSHNASAVMRTCECLGVQDIHMIESSSQWSTNKQVLKGSDKWLSILRYRKKNWNNADDCFQTLRTQGYRIAVTDPSPDGVPIEELDLDTPIAIVMGNEKDGTSPFAIENADVKVNIPMVGFTESMNISVSAAICMNSVLTRLRASSYPWQMKEEEKALLRLQWYKKAVNRSELLEREFLKSIQ